MGEVETDWIWEKSYGFGKGATGDGWGVRNIQMIKLKN